MKKWTRIVTISFLIILCIVGVYAVFGELLLPSERKNQDNICEKWKEGWYYIGEDGSREEITVPGSIDVPRGEEGQIFRTLGDNIDESAYVIYRSAKQDVRVYVGDELRASYTTADSRLIGSVSTTYYLMAKLHPEDAGKELRVVFSTNSRYSGAISEVFYANYKGFMSYMIKTQGTVFFASIIILSIGTLTLILSIILSIAYKKEQKLTSISGGVLIIASWMFFNSVFRQFIFPNVSVIGDLTFMMVALMPFPFAYYINLVQNRRYKIIYLIIEMASIVDFVSATALYILGIVDFSESFYAMGSIMALLVVAIAVTVVLDIINKHIKEYIATAITFILAGMVSIAQVVVYLTSDETLDITLAMVGLMVILLMAVADTIKDAYSVNEEKRIAIAENIAKTQFLANMSHEIRTPINAVLGMDTMIIRECQDDNIRKYALDIQSAGKSLLSIINDILDFSKIESGKMELVEAEYDSARMFMDLVNIISPKAEAKGLELNVDISEEIPLGMIGDDVRIRQIILNLLTNAVKYTQKGSVELRVDSAKVVDGVVLYVSVRDTGIGIKKEDIDKLTEEFVRIEESRNRNIEGTGLGLNIVVSLLQLMGSRLEVESEYGRGSNFHFTVKQKISDSTPMGDFVARIEDYAVDIADYEVAFSIPDAKLLVVDDNSMNRRVFKSLLSDMKCKIDEAESGKECLRLVETNKYDIIFMDHMMPQMDGIETYRRMKAMGDYINAQTPVVILTANAISGAREAYMSEGFSEYITKPVDPDKLEQMIGKLISEDKKIYSQKEKGGELRNKNASDKLPFIDGVDWDAALRKLNDEKLLLETIEGFSMMALSELKNLKSMYEAVFDSDNFADYRIRVHGMKSSAAMIGAFHVAGLAKYLEYAARDEDKDTLDRLMPVFEREWVKLKESIDQAFGYREEQVDIASENTMDSDKLKEGLLALRESMKELDIDVADEIIAVLYKQSFVEEQASILNELSQAVTNMDIEKCSELIDKWVELL